MEKEKIQYISEVYKKDLDKVPVKNLTKEQSQKYLDDLFSEIEEIPAHFGASPNIDSEYLVASENPECFGEIRRKYFFSDGKTAMHINMRTNMEFGFSTVLLKYNPVNYNAEIRDFTKKTLGVTNPEKIINDYI